MVGEPCARATQLLAFRSAAITMWGTSGWQSIVGALPHDTREALVTGDLVVAVGWVPERHLVKLAEVVFAGPAQGNMDTYREFIRHVIELGFGRVRRILVQFAHPHTVLRRAPELWRHDHTHGELVVSMDEKSAVVYVTHDVLTATSLARATCAEMFRVALGLTRARDVIAEHGLDDSGRLRVFLRWA
jgi:hypothetical protein